MADIHDVDMLRYMEADYCSFRLSEIVMDDIEMAYDFGTLCDMHHHIFQDIYEWAGKPRVINIEKTETVLGEISIEYSDCFDIAKDAKFVLSEMNAFDWQTARMLMEPDYSDISERYHNGVRAKTYGGTVERGRRGEKSPINFDEDCGELSPAMMKAFRSAVVQKNHRKKA